MLETGDAGAGNQLNMSGVLSENNDETMGSGRTAAMRFTWLSHAAQALASSAARFFDAAVFPSVLFTHRNRSTTSSFL